MFAVLIRRNFALLWAGHTASILGDYIFFIAITFWVYARTGSSLATGAVLVSSTLPLMLFASIAGRVVDRYDRRRVMLLAEGARGLLFLLALAVILRRPDALWPIYVVSFAQSALAAFFWPARSATLPQLAPGESLLAANAFYQLSDGAVRVVAPTLAALVLLRSSAAGVVALDAVTFVISTACIAAMAPQPLSPAILAPPSSVVATPRPLPSHVPNDGQGHDRAYHGGPPQQQAPQPGKPPGKPNTLDGELVAIYAIGAVVAFVGGTLGVLLPIFVRVSLRAGPLAYGWLFTAQALGDIVVSALLSCVARTQRSPGRSKAVLPIAVSLVGAGTALIIIAAISALTPALAMNVIVGGLTAFASVQSLTLLQRGAPGQWLGRRLARYAAAQACAQLAGLALASLLAIRIQAPWLIALDGAITMLCGGIVWGTLATWPMFHVKQRLGRNSWSMFHMKH